MKLTNYQGTKSILSRSAQINRPCALLDPAVSQTGADGSFLLPLLKIDASVYYISLLMFSSGLRVSEALSLDLSNYVGLNKIVIHGLKGSDDRIVDVSLIADYIKSTGFSSGLLFRTLDRYYVYRCFKKADICFKSVKSSKWSVTHSLRHLHVQGLRSNNISESLISSSIGQKNVKNAEKYGYGSKKRASH